MRCVTFTYALPFGRFAALLSKVLAPILLRWHHLVTAFKSIASGVRCSSGGATATAAVQVPDGQSLTTQSRDFGPLLVNAACIHSTSISEHTGSYSERHVVRDGGCYSAGVGVITYRTQLRSLNVSLNVTLSLEITCGNQS